VKEPWRSTEILGANVHHEYVTLPELTACALCGKTGGVMRLWTRFFDIERTAAIDKQWRHETCPTEV
jgi:hypothetical protein